MVIQLEQYRAQRQNRVNAPVHYLRATAGGTAAAFASHAGRTVVRLECPASAELPIADLSSLFAEASLI